jgi:peptide/nickel transport system substrate-binding protein
VEPLEWGRFKADVEAGRVQMWSLSWVGFKDPDIYRYAFATENFPPAGGNRGWYSNPELDKLLSEARAVTDFAKRRELYNKVQEIVAKELPYVFLWHEEIFAVVKTKHKRL